MTEQETGVIQRLPSQNSYFLRKKVAYDGMGIYWLLHFPSLYLEFCTSVYRGPSWCAAVCAMPSLCVRATARRHSGASLSGAELTGTRPAPITMPQRLLCGLEGEVKQRRIMARDRFQGRLWRRGERWASATRVVDGRQEPEVALGIPHDPLLMGLRDKEGHETLGAAVHVGL